MTDKFTYTGSKIHIDIEFFVDRMLAEADRLIDDLVLKYKDYQINGGMSKRAAAKATLKLITDVDDVVKVWENRQNRVIAEMTNKLVASPVNQYAKEKPDTEFDWILGSVKTSHCADCNKLSKMKPRTLKEWRKLGYGLPREGQTECSYGCKCMLTPVEVVDVKVTVPKKLKEYERAKV